VETAWTLHQTTPIEGQQQAQRNHHRLRWQLLKMNLLRLQAQLCGLVYCWRLWRQHRQQSLLLRLDWLRLLLAAAVGAPSGPAVSLLLSTLRVCHLTA
jgi:hypothetical protein